MCVSHTVCVCALGMSEVFCSRATFAPQLFHASSSRGAAILFWGQLSCLIAKREPRRLAPLPFVSYVELSLNGVVAFFLVRVFSSTTRFCPGAPDVYRVFVVTKCRFLGNQIPSSGPGRSRNSHTSTFCAESVPVGSSSCVRLVVVPKSS